MIILVLNCGSSSIKYKLYDMSTEEELATGLVEKIGSVEACFRYKNKNGVDKKECFSVPNHAEGILLLVQYLTDPLHGMIKDIHEIKAVGHRVVHGGDKFSKSVLIDNKVIDEILKCIPLAPLHNPPNLTGIKECMKILQGCPQIAVFDTAFHQTLPDYAYFYPIPYKLYENDRIRRYGFHGTSHRYVAGECAILMNKPLEDLRIITCHLGNGSSIAAIDHGKSVDTTMGFTPLEGVMMGTRSGTIDPAIIFHLYREKGMSIDEIDTLLNKKSGFLGITEMSNDLRDVTQGAKDKNPKCILALELSSYQVKKYIGSYVAAMNGVDAIVFTGGVGENTEEIREISMTNMEYLGIELDKTRNLTDMKKTRQISTDSSSVKVFVIFTNEEIMIARDTINILRH